MRLLTIALMMTSLLLASGCSDDTVAKPDQPLLREAGPTPEQSVANKEASTPQEASAPLEASTPTEGGLADFPASNWTCKLIGECQKPCKIDLTCLDACKAKGCATAKTAMDAVWACATANCLAGGCLEGFGPTCETCLQAKCKTVYDACQAQTC